MGVIFTATSAVESESRERCEASVADSSRGCARAVVVARRRGGAAARRVHRCWWFHAMRQPRRQACARGRRCEASSTAARVHSNVCTCCAMRTTPCAPNPSNLRTKRCEKSAQNVVVTTHGVASASAARPEISRPCRRSHGASGHASPPASTSARRVSLARRRAAPGLYIFERCCRRTQSPSRRCGTAHPACTSSGSGRQLAGIPAQDCSPPDCFPPAQRVWAPPEDPPSACRGPERPRSSAGPPSPAQPQ